MRNRVANAIFELAKKDKSVFLIAGDAGLGVWDEYQASLKEQFINPGINEALCVGMAAGMALAGLKPIYYNIAPFVIMRPYEQVRNDLCYQELPVILIGTGAGLTYAPSGMTHYVVDDLGLCATLPNLEVYSPCSPLQALACFQDALKNQTPSYIRIEKSGERELFNELPNIHKLNYIKRDSDDLLIIAHGSIINETLDIPNISVASLAHINSKDKSIFADIKSFKKVFVLEEHFSSSGLGAIFKNNPELNGIKIQSIALKEEYIHKIGSRQYLRSLFKIDNNAIKEYIEAHI